MTILFFQIYILIKNCLSIIIPIKTKNPEFNSSNIIPYYISRQFCSNIELGTPKQNVLLFINQKENSFYLDKIDKNLEINELDSQYDYFSSSSSQLLTEFDQIYGKFYRGAYISENFYFYENINKPKILFKNITFFLSTEDENNLYFTAGLGLQKKSKEKGFIEVLKDSNCIKSYDWFLNYTNKKNDNEEIVLIIGQKPHEYYPQYYSENQILSMNSYYSYTYLKWGILFNKIFINNQSFSDLLDSEINYNYASLLIPYDYWDYIQEIYFNEYINLNICSILTDPDNKMRYFFCDKNKFNKNDIIQAPTIYFYSVQFKYTFEIKGEDLFELKNDKYYFLLFSQTFTYSWILGKPFFKKYPFLYNIESKTISFYNPKIPYEDSYKRINYKKNYILIIIILILILILSLIFCLFLICKNPRHRKIRSNELEDEFVYKPQDNYSNINNNSNNI